MGWLLRDGEVLASLEIARRHRAKAAGLLGRDGFDGALLLDRTRSVHTIGMRFPIDVAFCNRDLEVLRTVRLTPGRVTRPHLGARCVIEARAGSFARWNLVVGDRLEVDEANPGVRGADR